MRRTRLGGATNKRVNEVKHYLLPFILLLVAVASAQDQQLRIGEVEFYGAAGVDLEKIRAALPFREGDTISKETGAQKFEQAKQAIKQLTGRTPTEIAPICCDNHGGLIVFIGLSGQPMRYSLAPKGKARFPASVNKLYDEWWNTLKEGIRQGASEEDWSQGYALSKSYSPLRAIQLRVRAYALRHDALIRRVLETSTDNDQRAKAAELLGYARSSDSQLTALVRACRDSNGDVRNNATRALVVLVVSKPELARRIQPGVFIEMLMSGTWTDVNKSSGLLADLTHSRDPQLLAELRRPAIIERLVEMARWRTGHANSARLILGRIAGIDETRLLQLVAAGQVDQIINALHPTR
ncbi:MAG: hypothetical protein QOC96_705 [Acidobacteriota bacterium]|nr:hypothetical protein [Acidobacteriota bacterium]